MPLVNHSFGSLKNAVHQSDRQGDVHPPNENKPGKLMLSLHPAPNHIFEHFSQRRLPLNDQVGT